MNMENLIKNKLRILNYLFTKKDNKLIVKLGFNLNCLIEIKEGEPLLIKGVLSRWNVLTGFFSLSMNWLMIYNTFWLFFLLFIQLYFNSNKFNLPYLPFIVLAWFLMWTFYYLIRFYLFKNFIATLVSREC